MKVLGGEKVLCICCNESFHFEASYWIVNGVKDDMGLNNVNNEIIGAWWD